jgi:excisionase family DNA binding protein
MSQEGAHALASRVVTDPIFAKTLTQDQAIDVVGILGAALAAAQVQAVRPAAGAASPALPQELANRLTINTEEAAGWLGLEDDQIQDLCRRGEIRAAKPGKAWLIRPESIREWLAHQEEIPRDGGSGRPQSPRTSRRPLARVEALPSNVRQPP